MRELKDRIYLFGMTRFTVGKLAAYRSDDYSIKDDADIDDIFIMKLEDKDRLVSLQGQITPFCFVAKCRRGQEEFAVIFIRVFYDVYSIYTAAELAWSYEQVCAALSTQNVEFVYLSDEVSDDVKRYSDVDIKDENLLIYVNKVCDTLKSMVCGVLEAVSPDADNLESISEKICEFVGVQLTVEHKDLGKRKKSYEYFRFSWKLYSETLELMACIARKYSRDRKLGITLERDATQYCVGYRIDFINDEARQKAERAITALTDMRGDIISCSDAEAVEYTFIPAELELEFVGVKYDFFECFMQAKLKEEGLSEEEINERLFGEE